MNHSEKDRLRGAFQQAYGDRLDRPGLRERILAETAARQQRGPRREAHWTLSVAAAALAILVVAALVLGGRLIHSAATVPAHRPAPSAGATPGAANPGPASSPEPSPTPAGCRVPFYESAGGSVSAHWTTPDGTTEDAPDGTFTRQADNLYRSTPTPLLVGDRPGYYDSAQRRWLPVGRQAVSPGGARYAYATGFGSVHIVDVSTGADHAYPVPNQSWQVLDFASDGIYLRQVYEAVAPGLWKLDLPSGQVKQVVASDRVDAVSDGVAWVEDVDASAGALVSQFAGGSQPNRLSRLDLRTGARTRWVTTPNAVPTVIGYDIDGWPFVEANGDKARDLLFVPGPGQVHTLASYPYGNALEEFGAWTAVADQTGEWVSGLDGVYRYDASGFHRVATTAHAAIPANRCV